MSLGRTRRCPGHPHRAVGGETVTAAVRTAGQYTGRCHVPLDRRRSSGVRLHPVNSWRVLRATRYALPMVGVITLHMLRTERRVPQLSLVQLGAGSMTVLINLWLQCFSPYWRFDPELLAPSRPCCSTTSPGSIFLHPDHPDHAVHHSESGDRDGCVDRPGYDLPEVGRIPEPVGGVRVSAGRPGVLLSFGPVRLERDLRLLACLGACVGLPRGHVGRCEVRTNAALVLGATAEDADDPAVGVSGRRGPVRPSAGTAASRVPGLCHYFCSFRCA